MKKIVRFDDYVDYSEISQSDDLTFSFIHETGDALVETHGPIKCRDFYNEALVGCQLGWQPEAVYGFTYPVHEWPIQFDKLRQLLRGRYLDRLIERLPLLNDFEEELGWEKTTITKFEPSEAYLEAAPQWLRASPMISLYTHLIRCLYAGDTDGHEDLLNFLIFVPTQGLGNASQYQRELNKIDIKELLKNLDTVFPEGTLPTEGMSEIDDAYDFHDDGGIVSFTQSVIGDIDPTYYLPSVDRAKDFVIHD